MRTSLEKITAKQSASARIYVRDNCPINSLLARLEQKGDGRRDCRSAGG